MNTSSIIFPTFLLTPLLHLLLLKLFIFIIYALTLLKVFFFLSKSPSQTKIINSIKSFKPLKAPGPDSIHPFFYQKYIHNILPSITNLFNEIFTSGKFPAHLNKTLIALIPKSATPETINQYRPIGLCNNICKTFTKIIVNKLRHFFNRIIDPLQSSFLPKRFPNDVLQTIL